MKKSLILIISLVAVFFFAGINQAQAQWTINVTWDPSACSCSSITKKVIEWEIRKVSDNSLISEGTKDVTTYTNNSDVLTGNDSIYDDTFYRVCVRVKYYEASIVSLCCTGTKCDNNVDGGDLTGGNYSIFVTLE